MAMNCLDIEYTHKCMKDSGVEVEDIRTIGEEEAKYFYFVDNQGNLLEAAWSKWDQADDMKDSFLQ